jgi:acyl-CoA synthetase (NDP forming)
MAPAWLSVNNPVDIWISMASRRGFGEMVSVLEEAFRLLLSEPQVHGLLFIGATFEPEMPQEMARVLTNVADEFPDKPVTSFLYGQYVQGGDDAMSMSGKAANFPSVERAIRALSHLAWYYDRVHVP